MYYKGMSTTSGLFAQDGCVTPNIRTRDYRITFAAKCEHKKIRYAEIVISAPSQEDALLYAQEWLGQGVFRQVEIVAIGEAAAF